VIRSVWNLYSGKYDRSQSRVVTTNAIYRCEELEDAASLYDDINDQCQYDDLNKQTMELDVLADQADDCDQHDKPPELPLPRESVYLDVLPDESSIKGSEPSTPRLDAKSDHGTTPATPPLDTTSPDHDQGGSDYEGLKTEEPDDHEYIRVNSESEEHDSDH